MITVAATVNALFPLASHCGPLWEPMCYAQIGGLSVATFITLLLGPVIYATFRSGSKTGEMGKGKAQKSQNGHRFTCCDFLCFFVASLFFLLWLARIQ